ncbi:MAG: CAP domain-containing protein [Rubrivivax sp.]|nr:MAG: CAP domain-containing protein [Rubrivivax sp.]
MRVLLFAMLALAATAPAVRAADCQPDPESAMRALNAVRAQPQACGDRQFAAAPALRWHPTLGDSASGYAAELAARDRLDHVSISGATLRTRLREAGYLMRTSGENLAGGQETLDEVVAQWLVSPAHCENLMLADFQEFGMGCAEGPGQLQRFWVLQLAAPVGKR